MKVFRELRNADLRKVNGLTRRMARCERLGELEQLCIAEVPRLVRMDYLAWNVFNLQCTHIRHIGATPGVEERAMELMDEVNAYLANWHPILSTVGWAATQKKLATMSDFQSIGAFRRTPLYRYAYRHLEADYQAGESIGKYGNIKLIMTYNRRLRDFTGRERAILHLLNRRLDAVAREVYRHDILMARCKSLGRVWTIGKFDVNGLTPGEIDALSALLRGRSVARDTRARLRDKLGLENSKQLAALAAEGLRG